MTRDTLGIFVVPLLLHLPFFAISAVETVYKEPFRGWEGVDFGQALLFLGITVAGALLACAAQALAVRRTAVLLAGFSSPLESDFRFALRRAPIYFVVTLLLLLVVAAGLLILVLPGLVALYFWSFAPIACLLEGTGVRDSLSRSRRAVRGQTGRWVACAAALVAAYSLASWAVFAFFDRFADAEEGMVSAVSDVLLAAALQGISLASIVAWTSLYLSFRAARDAAEGVSSPPLAGAGPGPSEAVERARAASLFE
jgi:hypothetical protein